MSEWTWWGRAGHFINAKCCFFHLHTHVQDGRYCVSTIGEYYPSSATEMQTLGGGKQDYYETMIFPLGDDGEVSDWIGLDTARYADHEAARDGHMAACREWDTKTEGDE